MGILQNVPRITQSLPHMLGEEIVVDFGIPYLTIPDKNSFDLLLGVDYQDLITWLPGPESILKWSNLQASHTPVGWVISRWQNKPSCTSNKTQEMQSTQTLKLKRIALLS